MHSDQQEAATGIENSCGRMGHANEERDLSASRPRRRDNYRSRGLPFGCALQRLRYSNPQNPGRIRGER